MAGTVKTAAEIFRHNATATIKKRDELREITRRIAGKTTSLAVLTAQADIWLAAAETLEAIERAGRR